MKVETPFNWLSPDPTRAKIESVTAISAELHGTKQPSWAIRTITPVCRWNKTNKKIKRSHSRLHYLFPYATVLFCFSCPICLNPDQYVQKYTWLDAASTFINTTKFPVKCYNYNMFEYSYCLQLLEEYTSWLWIEFYVQVESKCEWKLINKPFIVHHRPFNLKSLRLRHTCLM